MVNIRIPLVLMVTNGSQWRNFGRYWHAIGTIGKTPNACYRSDKKWPNLYFKNVIAPEEFGRDTYNFVRDVCSTFKNCVCILLLIFLQLQRFIFNANFLTFHFVSINRIKGNENTFILLVFSASKDLSAVSLPAHYLNDTFSITKQLSLAVKASYIRSCITSCQIWLITCYFLFPVRADRQDQFILLGPLGADTRFKFTVTWYQKIADSFDLKDGGSAFYSP